MQSKQQRSRLKPIAWYDITDTALFLYRRNFRIMIGESWLFVLGVLLAAATPLLMIGFMLDQLLYGITLDDSQLDVLAGFAFFQVLGGRLASPLAVVLGTLLVAPGLITVTAERYLGYELQTLTKRFAPLLIVTALVFVPGIVSVMQLTHLLANAPGLAIFGTGINVPAAALAERWLSGIPRVLAFGVITAATVWFVFVPHALMLETPSLREAVKQSVRLVRGDVLRVAGALASMMIVVAALTAIPAMIATLPLLRLQEFDPPPAFAPEQFLRPLALMALAPIPLICTTILYLDLRVRQDGLDLVVATEQYVTAQWQQVCNDGIALAEGGDYVGATVAFRTAARLKLDDPTALIWLVHVLSLQKSPEALVQAERLVAAHPELVDGVRLRSQARLYLGDVQGALADANAAVVRMPRDELVLRQRAYVYFKLGEYERAYQDLLSVMAATPQAVGPYFDMARGYAKQGDLEHLLVWLQKAITLEPAFARAAQRETDFAPFAEDARFRAVVDTKPTS